MRNCVKVAAEFMWLGEIGRSALVAAALMCVWVHMLLANQL